jgi:hypothetical protein
VAQGFPRDRRLALRFIERAGFPPCPPWSRLPPPLDRAPTARDDDPGLLRHWVASGSDGRRVRPNGPRRRDREITDGEGNTGVHWTAALALKHEGDVDFGPFKS